MSNNYFIKWGFIIKIIVDQMKKLLNKLNFVMRYNRGDFRTYEFLCDPMILYARQFMNHHQNLACEVSINILLEIATKFEYYDL